MEVLREAPKTSSFVPLAEHQSATPASFYAGPPVLHYYSDRSKVIILETELQNAPALAPLVSKASSSTHHNGDAPNGDSTISTAENVVDDVDVWVTSDKLYLYSPTAAAGVSIPYPCISLHAIQSLPLPSVGEQQGLYMQLITSSSDSPNGAGEDIEPDSISVTIIPTASAPPATTSEESDDPIEAEDRPEQTPVTAMFTALSNCSNLHPDPIDPEDEGEVEDGGSRLFQSGLAIPGDMSGGLPPAMPGSGGWITAENMHEFVDEDGNWIEQDGDDDDNREEGQEIEEQRVLGPGAGTVRRRGSEGDLGDGAKDDHDGLDASRTSETKWRRTD